MATIDVTPDFEKAFRRLPVRIQRLATKKTSWFRDNAHDSRLKTHKLSGQLNEHWSFSVNREYRILFEFTSNTTALFHSIGTHAIYR
ncbi:type II toxin-antitoxin system RelE/ParE family toxin [Candidatus Berkelbacteria bacterium]|nr:type II toxin-antitoxin system RelE/ParE family toxin [Candidatus Berkelbacteria bacterium]